MRKYGPALLIAFLFACGQSVAQSAWRFSYTTTLPGDTTRYDAFLVQRSGGTGFLRVRFSDPVSGETVLIHYPIRMTELPLAPGISDPSRFYYDTTEAPDVIYGNPLTQPSFPLFYFHKDSSQLFSPEAVRFRTRDTGMAAGRLLSNYYVDAQEWPRSSYAAFFTEEEDFIKPAPITPRGLTAKEKAVRLYMLVVANTNDSTVGIAARMDMDNMVHSFDTIARFLGIQMMPPVIISGKNYNKQNVEKAIRYLSPGENDIVVFYYTGHGFRKNTDSRIYPYIDLRPKPDGTFNINSLNIKDVYDSIRLKRTSARLNIVIADCCNTFPDDVKRVGKSIVIERATEPWSQENCARLFLDSTASILLASAGVNQEATCDDVSGSFCSIFFRSALSNNLIRTNRQPSWQSILTETNANTSYKARHICCNPEPPCTPAKACSQSPLNLLERGRATGFFRRLF